MRLRNLMMKKGFSVNGGVLFTKTEGSTLSILRFKNATSVVFSYITKAKTSSWVMQNCTQVKPG
jgi:hypothetical protein